MIYLSVIKLRNWLYDKGVLRAKKAPLPIISIGNVVVGGSGKTQVVDLLARELEKRVAILSRGYKGRAEKNSLPTLVDEKCEAEVAGDEPYMLSRRLRDAWVIVGRNRLASAQLAKELGAEVALLDDGMQHRRLERDIEIVVVGTHDPLGGGRYLPFGRLRDDPKRIDRADFVLFCGEGEMMRCKPPCARAQVEMRQIHTLQGESLSSIAGMKVAIFCGIGSPKRFEKSVCKWGAEVVERCFLRDHQKMGEGKLAAFAQKAKRSGAELVLCTEKDRVKLSTAEHVLPVAWIECHLKITENVEEWQELIQRINA